VDVFWGVTTVTGARAFGYWQTRNRAIFPQGFEPTLTHSRTLAREALQFARDRGANLYFMPIRAGVTEYLQGIL
jgi:methylenetetrahydrofolate reductase (NADPH)